MKNLQSIEVSEMIHHKPDTTPLVYSGINVFSNPAIDPGSSGFRLEGSGGDASNRGSIRFDSTPTGVKTFAGVPRRLWVEFLLYTIATIAIQILCIVAK